MPRLPRLKRSSYELIDRESKIGKELHGILNDLIERFHAELTGARIALAWNLAWKPDVDGRVILGKCKKASDLDRELAPYDFVILLRRFFFEDGEVSNEQRRALIDHELTHATVKLDRRGEPVEDLKGRKVYRLRKHDLEEFSAVVERHGLYKRDIEQFAAALRRSKQRSLLDGEVEKEFSVEKLNANPNMRVVKPKANGKRKGAHA
jgi:hypothetical protein